MILVQRAKQTGLLLGALLLVSSTVGMRTAWAQYPSDPQITKDGMAVLLQDYASPPLSSRTTGSYPPLINYAGQLGRVNFLRSEPATAPQSSSRSFVNDLNRNLYILDKTTKTFTPYINFEEVFRKFDNDPGYAGGLVTFAFDPAYADNGTFYTVHTEDPHKSGSAVPTNTSLPGLDLSGGYSTTPAVNPPAGTVVRQAVLVEWTDTNRNNSTFEGTARELLRVGFNSNIHPMGDLLINPLAKPGDADYRNLYITVGDGAAGETYGASHTIPQRLDALQGKILRITPDTTLNPGDELSPNGRYRIPTSGADPNPFVSLTLPDLKKEIYAYGFRNPHRMSWDPVSNKLLVDDIGLYSWEEVNILTKGTNYGYAEREGIEQLFVTNDSDNGLTGSQTSPPTPFPDPDSLTVTGIDAPVTPVYPVAAYSHTDGDAISSGFVYHGSLMSPLDGKYIFGDITTARLFYADVDDMILKDDGDRLSLAAVHELQVVFDSPYDNPDQGPVNRRLFDIVADEYTHKGGDASGSSVLPGSANVTSGDDSDGIPYGGGRADIRLAVGGDGEIYVLSKSDGMIRALVAVVAPPADTTPPSVPTGVTATVVSATQVNLTWIASTDEVGVTGYRVERCQGAGCSTFIQIATPTGTTYSDTGLTPSTSYSYQVKAVDATGNVSEASPVTSATTKRRGKWQKR
jgi:glucose/sorbosone dehydrogenase/fibronectin type III domain protein